MWEPVQQQMARMGKAKSPPPSEKPEIGNGKKWFAPRKFSDKIALQMKRQEALEETLRQVDAPPVTSPAAIDPEFSSHPAARSFFPATHQPIQKRTEPAPVAHAGPQRLAAIAPAPPTPATPGHPDAQHFGFPPPGYRYHPLADNYPEHCFRQQAPRQPHGHSFERAYNVSAYPTSSTDASFSSSSHGHNAHSDDAYSSSAAQNYVIMTPKSVSGSNEGFVPSPPSSNLRSSYSDGDTPGTGVFAYSSQASSSHHAYAGNANAGSSHFFIDSILDRNERTSRSSDTASIHSVHTTSGQPYSLAGHERGGSVRLQRSMSKGEESSSIAGRRAMSLKAPHRHRHSVSYSYAPHHEFGYVPEHPRMSPAMQVSD